MIVDIYESFPEKQGRADPLSTMRTHPYRRQYADRYYPIVTCIRKRNIKKYNTTSFAYQVQIHANQIVKQFFVHNLVLKF